MSAPELTEIRSPLDQEKFKKFLETVSPSSKIHIGYNACIPQNFKQIQQFTFGQSNPTYLITDTNGKRFVLRRKPSPNSKLISKLAHAVEENFSS